MTISFAFNLTNAIGDGNRIAVGITSSLDASPDVFFLRFSADINIVSVAGTSKLIENLENNKWYLFSLSMDNDSKIFD